jgi:hypothetical protein
MNRLEFTINIVGLLKSMIDLGEHPIIDYVKRSPEEQNRLFKAGLSKCDGINQISAHQVGKAIDILFPDVDDYDYDGDTKELIPPKHTFKYWHDLWESWGGKPIIDWDKGHFE